MLSNAEPFGGFFYPEHFGNVESEARIEPPIQTEYFLSGGAMTLIFIVGGANWIISFSNLVLMPGYIDVPPDKTMFP